MKIHPDRAVLVVVTFVVLTAACTANGSSSTTVTTAPSEATSTTSETRSTQRSSTTATIDRNPCPGAFCVRYEIQPDAVWSDGEPVTSADFLHTYQAMVDPLGGSLQRSGYELISDQIVIDDKTILFVFSDVYPPWRTLFDVLIPAHYDGDFNEPGAPVTGPFVLEEWVAGERIVLRRNSAIWTIFDTVTDGVIGDVEELVFVFPESVRDQLRALEDGEIDVINPRPLDWMAAELASMDEKIEYELVPGAFWEHIDFNHDDPLLSQRWVRQAISLAIDREAILEQTVRRVDPSAAGLDSAIFLANSSYYEDNYDHVYDPGAAERILNEHLCEKGDDGLYSCQGRKMSFAWTTTVGDEDRERIYELARETLEAVGIEVTLQLRVPSNLFSRDVLFGGPEIWQIINFSWKGEADPYLANSTFDCRGDAPSGFGALNVNRYCNDEVESLIRSTERLFHNERRVAAYSEADSIYLDDLAMVPLFQKPALLAWNKVISGPEPNISSATDLWNIGSWSGKESVVIALESEPASLDPIRPDGDSARAILSAMFHGAYSINPSLEFTEVLLADAEALAGGG